MLWGINQVICNLDHILHSQYIIHVILLLYSFLFVTWKFITENAMYIFVLMRKENDRKSNGNRVKNNLKNSVYIAITIFYSHPQIYNNQQNWLYLRNGLYPKVWKTVPILKCVLRHLFWSVRDGAYSTV